MGIGMILAGGLQGLGNGIAAKGASDIAQLREQALEKLRSENNITEINARAAGDDWVKGRDAKRDDAYARGLIPIKTAAQKDVDANRVVLSTQKDMKLEGLRQTNRVALENVQLKNNLTRDSINFARTSDEQARKDGTYIDHYDTAADGTMVGVTKTGKIYRSNVKLMPKGNQGDDPLLAPRGGTTPAGPAVAAPSPVYTPPPVAPDYSSSDDPALAGVDSYGTGGGFGQGTAAVAADVAGTTGMTYTMADLAALKREAKMTDAQARQWFTSRGYKLGK